MEELGLPYDIVLHRRQANGRSPDTLRAIHPAAESPTIEDNGIAMVESTGVLLYILETYGNGCLRPAPGTADAMRFFQWLTYIEGSAKGPVLQFFRLLRAPANDATRAQIEQAVAVPLGLIDTALANSETIVPGQFTAADIQLCFLEELVEGLGQIGNWPNMRGHLARMRERDAYKCAEAKGGAVGLKEMFSAVVR
jgi:glutathione S-transferase